MSSAPSEPTVLIFADADDVGVGRLANQLTPHLKVLWWRFGVAESSVSIYADQTAFELNQSEASLDSEVLRDAALIIYRRRLLQPRPLVTSGLASRGDREFSEREWGSLVDGLLLAEQSRARATWMNSPSATLLCANKLFLVLEAARRGLQVPRLSISTPVRLPESASGDLVTKAISANERIDESRYFSTAKLSTEDLTELPGTRLPTPSLVQEYVTPKHEIRVFFALGKFLALALSPSKEYVDIRYASPTELEPRRHDLTPELCDALADLAKGLSLSYCTFDLVVPDDGPPALVDITPNGGWDYFESDSTPVISEFLAKVITSHVAGEGPK